MHMLIVFIESQHAAVHNAGLCIHAEGSAINQLHFDRGVAGACFRQDL